MSKSMKKRLSNHYTLKKIQKIASYISKLKNSSKAKRAFKKDRNNEAIPGYFTFKILKENDLEKLNLIQNKRRKSIKVEGLLKKIKTKTFNYMKDKIDKIFNLSMNKQSNLAEKFEVTKEKEKDFLKYTVQDILIKHFRLNKRNINGLIRRKRFKLEANKLLNTTYKEIFEEYRNSSHLIEDCKKMFKGDRHSLQLYTKLIMGYFSYLEKRTSLSDLTEDINISPSLKEFHNKINIEKRVKKQGPKQVMRIEISNKEKERTKTLENIYLNKDSTEKAYGFSEEFTNIPYYSRSKEFCQENITGNSFIPPQDKNMIFNIKDMIDKLNLNDKLELRDFLLNEIYLLDNETKMNNESPLIKEFSYLSN